MKLTIKARLVGSLAALSVAMIAIGASGWASTMIGDQRLQSVIGDRVLPMQQLKFASDAYAVSIVDAANKASAGALAPEDALSRVTEARKVIDKNWSAY